MAGCQWISDDSVPSAIIKPRPYKLEPSNERAPKPSAQLHRPFDFPLFLSGNFGELRANHFHGGIDFKTQGTTGHPIHCADDGYVSQVSVSGGGYGRAVYVTHPTTGLTTVYAHIDRFSPIIDKIVKARQYEIETFAITMRFEADELPVKKGEVIAYSGNSGYSFGPHLHMEVRHTASGDALDPLPYFKNLLADNVPPMAHAIMLYPHKDKGSVNGSKNATYQNHQPGESHSFNAWGMVYPALRANDYMSDVHNVYGVKHLTLTVDGKEVYRRTIDRFRTGATRAINTLVDYSDLNNTGNWNMHTYIPQSKPLGCMVESSLNGGAVNINEERVYRCEFALTDEYGNTTLVPFTIYGQKHDIASTAPQGKLVKLNTNDTISLDGLTLNFYEGGFYEDIYIDVTKQDTAPSYSAIYSIGQDNSDNPIARAYRIAIKIDNDTVGDKTKYCLTRVNGNHKSHINSRYKNGEMVGYVNRFGHYTVTTDIVAPKLYPINQALWGASGVVKYHISDNFSGIKQYRGEIDGRWVMFEADNKNSVITFALDPNKVTRGKTHDVKITATDNCGNTSTQSHRFTW